jgi:aspartyl-tRNA(Asn)/glutamyl-tRNA(Gln) amidotransferase subunit A
VSSEVFERDAWELADAVRAGTTSSRELVDAFLDRIQRLDPKLNAICHVDADAARARADAIDADVAAGSDPGPLAGVPVGVKELAAVEGWPDTEACLVYKARVADHDSAEVARLRAAGAVLTAQTTASEFGSVSFTNTPLHGITRNPWNPAHTPGGSSGGSAAAVAAGMLPICTGGDGGGSIRIPASYSGLLGMKTTYGLSGTGPGAYSFSETSVQGAMARSVRDSARYLDVISGPTLTDPHSLPKVEGGFEAPIVSGEAIDGLRGLRVAWSDTLGYGGAEPEVSERAWHAAEKLIDAAGMELVDIPVEMPKPGMSWGLFGTLNEMAFCYEDLRDRVADLTEVMRLSVMSYEHLRPEVLLKAIRGRRETVAASAAIFDQIDLLLTPTTPTPAFEAEGRLSGQVNGKDVSLMGLSAAFCAPFNLTGQPGCSVPAGLVDGLPVALQIVGPRHGDVKCLASAAVLEQAQPWSKLAPFAFDA